MLTYEVKEAGTLLATGAMEAPREIEIAAAGGRDPIPLLYWPGREGRGVLIIAHGVYSHAGWFRQTAPFFHAGGQTVVAYDRLGCGRSRSSAGHVEHYRDFVEELKSVIRWVNKQHPAAGIHLTGQSYGSLVVLMHAADNPQGLRSLTLITPGLATRKKLKPWQTALVPILARFRPGHSFPLPMRAADFTDSQELILSVEQDLLCGRRASARFYWQTLFLMQRARRTAPKIQTPVFMALAGHDAICDNAVAERFFGNLAARDKKLKKYERSMHSLLLGVQREELLNDWQKWILQHENPQV